LTHRNTILENKIKEKWVNNITELELPQLVSMKALIREKEK
jgi:hypothetical protein